MTTTSPTIPDLDPETRIRCSDWARATELSPIGTAGTFRGYLLIEVPLPWPRDINRTPEALAVAPLVGPLGYRVQAVLPEHAEGPAHKRRVILHAPHAGAAGFTGYRRLEARIGHSLVDTTAALLAAADDPAFGRYDLPGIDILVCTHGSRDSCCGRNGANLAVQLGVFGAHRKHVHLWRTSHTGGHRFAPTFYLLPEGTAWGYATGDVVDRVLRRRGAAADVVDHYRGCTGLRDQREQVLEAEVLRRVGWDLLSRPRTGHVDGSSVRLSWPEGGRTVTWAGEVEPGRAVPMPGCRKPAAEGTKFETEWAVSAVHRL
jgi:hypothetical protein